MSRMERFALEYAVIAPVSLLMLSLFDSNAWWKVLLFALGGAAIGLVLTSSVAKSSINRISFAFGRGVANALLAFIFGLTPFFRTTFGTLIGFSLLLSLAGLALNYVVKEKNAPQD